jgi:hypothetical protein
MITIKLEIASNGIIKTVSDDNYNGAGSGKESITVYETDDDPIFSNTSKFLYEVCDDLGVNLGNKFDQTVLNFEVDWGNKYEPGLEELNHTIKSLAYDLKDLKALQKDLTEVEASKTLIDKLKS